jgi:hypothetical protein
MVEPIFNGEKRNRNFANFIPYETAVKRPNVKIQMSNECQNDSIPKYFFVVEFAIWTLDFL